jgi:Uma2 family endonuclease
MVPGTVTPTPTPIVYPDSDGKPMAENTKQLRWITVLYGNLAAWFRSRDDVFVAGDNLWYPVEGHPEVCTAPDVYVVFGRHKGDRGSYKQWDEEGIPPTVVFEVLSPGNTFPEMIEKQAFYEEHGVEEYYLYDPDNNKLHAYLRSGEILARQRFPKAFVSPRLGIRFDLSGAAMIVYHPDGRRFLTYEEMEEERQQSMKRAWRLVELSRKARQQHISPEELAELERLENEIVSSSPGDSGHGGNGGV